MSIVGCITEPWIAEEIIENGKSVACTMNPSFALENEDNISIADMLVFATGYKINLAVKDSWHHISFDR